MAWFAAHAILYVRLKTDIQNQTSFPIWENVYLIEAESPEVALSAAEARAKEDEGDSGGSFTWTGHPAEMKFAGIRKLISVVHRLEASAPSSGDEVTYSQFEVASLADVLDIAQGLPKTVRYEE